MRPQRFVSHDSPCVAIAIADISPGRIPYGDNHFDFVHSRMVAGGINNTRVCDSEIYVFVVLGFLGGQRCPVAVCWRTLDSLRTGIIFEHSMSPLFFAG